MRILSYPQLKEIVPASRTTLWRWEKRGLFPPRVRLGPNMVGWCEESIKAWLASRPVGMASAPRGWSE